MGSTLPCIIAPTLSISCALELATFRYSIYEFLVLVDTQPSPLKPAELQVLRSRYEKEGEYGLIKSTARGEQQEGVRLLSEIFRNSPDRRRECLYYLALGNFKLGNFAEARRYNELLLDVEPANLQAGSLKGLIDDKVAREGLVGAAIVGGLAIAAGVAGSFMFRAAQRKR
ncbi:Mitochondria fission 1 protein [Cryomyces minteri]|uniref:Mitochondrial fission 1 protein n=1 Tax=Cryomyces minteri TaxID=331657 RepID=A0A4U0X1K4_9PEZI|nr:Mitochondria fission 1 protein [Cryomyces minteri]